MREMIILSHDPNPWFYTAAKNRLRVLPPTIILKNFEDLSIHISSIAKRFQELSKDPNHFRFLINLENERDLSKWRVKKK